MLLTKLCRCRLWHMGSFKPLQSDYIDLNLLQLLFSFFFIFHKKINQLFFHLESKFIVIFYR